MLKRYYENDLSAFFSQLDEKRNVTEADVAKIVSDIINDVKLGGDASLRKYTEKFEMRRK